MSSFTYTVKDEVMNLQDKNKRCCSFSLLYGFLFTSYLNEDRYYIKTANAEIGDYFIELCDYLFKKKHLCFQKNGKISIDSGVLRYFTIDEYKSKVFKCQECVHAFLRGVFLSKGTVTDPEKSYLLEISLDNYNSASDLLELLSELGLKFKHRERQGKQVIYTKNSESIEDLLALIGAHSATFTIMNCKIMKDLKNKTNRIMNCDDANINKSLEASKKYMAAINYLIESNNILRLPEQLKETVYLRLEHKELNYADFGRKFNPVISKSGVFHRLEKIVEIAEKLKKEN